MAKTLTEYKRNLKVGARIRVNNYCTHRLYVGEVIELHQTYFKVAREVTKKYYDECSPLLKNGINFFMRPDALGDDHYYEVSIISWQPAKHSKVEGNKLHFLSYPNTLNSGVIVNYPCSNIPIGQVWMTVEVSNRLY